jgi:hypothetical protein
VPDMVLTKLKEVTFNLTNGKQFDFVNSYFHQGYALYRMDSDGFSEKVHTRKSRIDDFFITLTVSTDCQI